MKKAGCKLVTVGFESADQESLNRMHKGTTVEQIRQFVSNTKKAGLLVHGCFIAGNPGETRHTAEKSLKLAKELNCDTMQFYPLLVYPGTEAYDWASKNEYLISDNYADWADGDGMYRSLLDLPGFTREENEAFCRRAIREYYLRPKYIGMKLLQTILHPGEIRRTLPSTKTFFKHYLGESK